MTETKNYTAGYRDCAGCMYELQTSREYPCSECREMVGPDYPNRYESKDTKPAPNNQTAKQDNGKPIYTHVPVGVIKAVEKVRAYGNAKYHSPDNWKQVESQRYWDATVRHVIGAWDDYTAIDPESGLPHIYHALCNLSFLAERMEQDSN